MLHEIVKKNRSYRRFKEDQRVDLQDLHSLIELARLCPSSRNQQALKFMPVVEKGMCDRIFPYLAWAGYLPDWKGPEAGQRPAAYVLILGDAELGSQFDMDAGITAQTILLGVSELGLGGCMIGSIRRDGLSAEIGLPESLKIILVLALGIPDEQVMIEPLLNKNIKYWRDENGVHHVPKRSLHEIIWPK